jgi:hypothetical protein
MNQSSLSNVVVILLVLVLSRGSHPGSVDA